MKGSRLMGLSQAFGGTLAIVAKAGRGRLDAPAPCASWDVRALISHDQGRGHQPGCVVRRSGAGGRVRVRRLEAASTGVARPRYRISASFDAGDRASSASQDSTAAADR